jgi:DNA (cytosine-5)-methyltransferase 1
MTLTVASMFSGIGLIDLGLERAGMETRLLCENDRAASTVLARRFPGIPIHPDIRELTADDLYAAGCQPDTTVAAAGFPCQDLSIAGVRQGMGEGTRSGLFWHVDRLLAEFAPRWVLLENVPGLLSSRGGRDMGAVLGALADRGYGYAYRVLDAQRFGVPQRRERVVIVGHLGEPWAAPAQVLLEPEGGGWDLAALRESGSRIAGDAADGTGVRRIAGTLTAHHGRNDADSVASGHFVVCVTGDRTHTLTANGADASEDGTGRGTPIVFQRVIRSGARLSDGSLPPDKWERREIAATLSPFDLGSDSRAIELVAADTEVRRLTPLECERLQGAPDEWTEGQADSPRYKQLGNSVAVPVFEWVGRRIVAVDAQIRAERAA